jgi:hypothetical protein
VSPKQRKRLTKNPRVVVAARVDKQTKRRIMRVMKSKKIRNFSETVEWLVKYGLDRVENRQ